MIESSFIEGEIEIRKKNDIKLLTELLNYYYLHDNNFNINHVINALHDNIIYDDKEKDNLLKESKKLLLEKYNIKLE